jgi:hypothetical protein
VDHLRGYLEVAGYDPPTDADCLAILGYSLSHGYCTPSKHLHSKKSLNDLFIIRASYGDAWRSSDLEYGMSEYVSRHNALVGGLEHIKPSEELVQMEKLIFQIYDAMQVWSSQPEPRTPGDILAWYNYLYAIALSSDGYDDEGTLWDYERGMGGRLEIQRHRSKKRFDGMYHRSSVIVGEDQEVVLIVPGGQV